MIRFFKHKKWVGIIKQSGLFDVHYYLLSYPDVRESDIDPVVHYVKFGAGEGRNPSDAFDTKLYVNLHKESSSSEMNPLVHYILNKKQDFEKENTSTGEEVKVLAEFEIIKKSGLFNEDYYLSTYADLVKLDIEPLWHFVKHGWKEGRNPSEHFNTQLYLDEFGGAARGNPLVQYINNKSHEGEAGPIVGDQESEVVDLIKSLNLEDEHKMIEFIRNKINSISIEGFFSSDDYLELYPDIKNGKINPLRHFLLHGRKEGRVGYVDLSAHTKKGAVEFNPLKETIVFVSHESSATGAPLLGFGIADKLAETYNIVHIVIREKNIHEVFLSNCDTILSGIESNTYTYSLLFLKRLLASRAIKCVVINSVVGYNVMYAAYKLNLPIVFLIHEFAEYMKPQGTMIDAVYHSDVLITPASIIQASVQKEFRELANHKELPSNMHILPQGKLPYIPDTYGDDSTADELYRKLGIEIKGEFKIIVGSGWVQPRKGVDLFITTARYIKKLYGGKCKFVWVGEGFDPKNDLAYSVYLDREMEFSGLGDDFVLLEHQKNLDAIFSIADVFCLSSRMDPFPNVVIDALSHDLHVACFENASGSAEFLRKHDANCTIVDFVDAYDMASGICKYLKEGNLKHNKNIEIVKNHLDFNQYVSCLHGFIDEAVAFRKKSNEITRVLQVSNDLDISYIGLNGTRKEKCRRYVENGLKGIHFHNPKVGFSEIDWIEKNSKGNHSVVPLYEALLSGDVQKHSVHLLPRGAKENLDFNYAVHLHLYYPEMARYFAQYFKNLPGQFDIYITFVNEDDRATIELEFRQCGASSLEIVLVENIGRDMGPFIFALKDRLQEKNYKVVGHFHSKKSLDLKSSDGDKWLAYLIEHLIGSPDNARDVLSLFNDERVGLVFPEDTNTYHIGENGQFVTGLCDMLKLQPINQTPVFPLGNMFWARLDAIKSLFQLDPEVILQSEPLPYDGSYMHALERITPHLVESNGYSYSTVYFEGKAWK